MTEESNQEKKQDEKERVISDRQLRDVVRAWKKEADDADVKSEKELLESVSFSLLTLNDIETRLSEHLEIDVFIARFGTGDNRRRELLLSRSNVRESLSFMFSKLVKLGLEGHELEELLPFVSQVDIQNLLDNRP